MNERQVLEGVFSLTETWRLQGRWQDVQTLLHGLQPVAKAIGVAAQARVWLKLGLVMSDEGMFAGRDTWEARQRALQQALTLAKGANEPPLLGDVHDALGMSIHGHYLAGDRSAEPPDELDHFETGLRLRRQGGTAVQVAESLFHVGLVYDVIRRDYDQAAVYHQQAYDMATEVGEKVIASYAIRHLGFAHMAAKAYMSAKDALEESLRLREEAGFVPGAAFSIIALAHWYMTNDDKTAALAKLKQAREMLVALGATSRVEWVERHIASLQ
ncbi:MAG: hypothetical protein AAF614_30460 [Chloroflexota bacterium]